MEVLESFSRFLELGLANNNTRVLFLFLGGILSGLLPCVYPLYPITIGILQRDQKGFSSIFLFLSGLVLFYFSLGFIAGISGLVLSKLIQNQFANFFLSYLFFLLTLSTIGFLPFNSFTSRNLFEKFSGPFGKIFIGYFTGLASSPCMGPVVASVLLNVVTRNPVVQSSNQVFTSTLELGIFGIGVGVPFFLFAVLGSAMPKSGTWMNLVKWIFGILIFSSSYYYFAKATPAFTSFGTNAIFLVLFGIFLFIFWFFRKIDWLPHRTKNSVLVFSAILMLFGSVGILLPIQQFQNSRFIFAKRFFLPRNAEKEMHSGLFWFRNSRLAFEEAQKTNSKIFIDFYADWCSNCKAFERKIEAESDLKEALSKAILLRITDEDEEFLDYQNDPRFSELKIGLPFFVITNAKDQLIFKTTNYLNKKDMIESLK